MSTHSDIHTYTKGSAATAIIWLVVILLAAGGIIWATSDRPSDDSMMEDDAMMQKDEMMDDTDVMMQKDGDAMDDKMTDGDSMMKDDEAMMSDGEMTKDDGAMMMQKGDYVSYAADKLAFAETGDVVLFFHASWCPYCRAADADITENVAAIPPSLLILKTDYDSQTALKQKYGVTYQHTFVQVDAGGNQIAKWSGSETLADIVAHVK